MTVLPLFRQNVNHQVLVLEERELLRGSMVRALSEIPNVSVAGSSSVQSVQAKILELKADLVVSDLDWRDDDGVELIRQLGDSGQTAVVFISADVKRFEPQLELYPGVVALDKPVPPRTLKYIVTERLVATRRTAPPFSAGDYVQLAGAGRYSVRIDVTLEGLSGTIFVRKGRLWSAQAGRVIGRPALRRLTFASGADVVCSGGPLDPGPANLPDLPWQQVLLDAAKDEDERAGKARSGKRCDEEFDFSGLLDETGGDSGPPDAQSRGREVPARDSPAEGVDSFEILLDRAHEALLRKNYAGALTAFEAAGALRQGDKLVEGNIVRLRQILEL